MNKQTSLDMVEKRKKYVDVPSKVRLIHAVIGLLAFFISIGILLELSTTPGDFLQLLSLAALPLFVLGIGRLIVSLVDDSLRNAVRAWIFIVGLMVILVCMMILMFPVFSGDFYLLSLCAILLLFGIGKFYRGISGKRKHFQISTGRRLILCFVGISSFILGLIVISWGALSANIAVGILVIGVMINGIDRIFLALKGIQNR